MNTNKESKPNNQRNITPNFLKYKSKSPTTQKSLPSNQAVQKKKASTLKFQLNAVAPKPVDAALTSIRKESFISAKSVLPSSRRKYIGPQS